MDYVSVPELLILCFLFKSLFPMLVAVSTVENVQERQYSLCYVDLSKPALRSFQMCVYFQRLMPSLWKEFSHDMKILDQEILDLSLPSYKFEKKYAKKFASGE